MLDDIAQAMKRGLRRWATGVSVISAVGQDGGRYAMTISSLTSVSDCPPSLLVCINKNARILEVLTPGKLFAVNLLGQSHADVSKICSTKGEVNRRFEVGLWSTTASGTPIITDAEAVFEGCVDKTYAYGTHLIVVAQLSFVTISGGSINPLIYCDGEYRSLAV